MAPTRTELAPAPSTPSVIASAPGCGSAAGDQAGAAASPTRNSATLVAGSRPASRASSRRPSASLTSASSNRRGKACSETTTRPWRHSVPERRSRPRTATLATSGPAAAARAASALKDGSTCLLQVPSHPSPLTLRAEGWEYPEAAATGRLGRSTQRDDRVPKRSPAAILSTPTRLGRGAQEGGGRHGLAATAIVAGSPDMQVEARGDAAK